jgi:hypothetical protein
MIKRTVLHALCASIVFLPHMNAYFDNRFLFPMNERISWRTQDKVSRVNAGAFFMTGKEARNESGDTVWGSDLGGKFDLCDLNVAMNLAGLKNPKYLTEWYAVEVPYAMRGKINAVGGDLAFEYGFNRHFALGAGISLLHVSTKYDLYITQKTRNVLFIEQGVEAFTGREMAVEQARLQANKVLGLDAGQWSATGFSDTDIYARIGNIKDYVWYFRQLDLSFYVGCILPTGEKQNLYAPSSVPFGGNGHYGMFGRVELAAEVTDDAFLGLWLYLSKRFTKTQLHRMPSKDEHLQYGAIVDRAKVNPGVTFGVSPYLIWDGIQSGFGAYTSYTFIHHTKDCWTNCGKFAPNLSRLEKLSTWTNEFFTFGVDYDFTKTDVVKEYGPRLYFDFVWPSNIFGAKNVAKTYKVSLGMEFHF